MGWFFFYRSRLMNSSDFNQSSLRSKRAFATTSWSLVSKARDEEDMKSEEALNELCLSYWYPLYAFARRKGNDRSSAEDLTQSFFAFFLESDGILKADSDRGRFRTFLLSSFQNFMANEWRSQNAQKRGGGRKRLDLDFDVADEDYRRESRDDWSPEKVFERTWALSMLGATMARLQEQYLHNEKGDLFEAIHGYLDGTNSLSYRETAEKLGMKEGAVKVAVHRLKERYGDQLRLQVASTLTNPGEVDDELGRLFAALG